MIKRNLYNNFFIFIMIVLLIPILSSCSNGKTEESGFPQTITKSSPTIPSDTLTKITTETPQASATPTPKVIATPTPKETDKGYTPPQYYDYTGGDLPKDIITPIKYTVSKKISPDKPEFIFEIYGENIQSYGLTANKDKYYMAHNNNKVQKIIIKCDTISFKQVLEFPETLTPNRSNYAYGFDLDDWNFDGNLDISLWRYESGTSLNSPHYYWLWDNERNTYATNKDIENISEGSSLTIDKNNHEIVANTRLTGGYYTGYYKWEKDNITLDKTEEMSFVDTNRETEKSRGHYIKKQLINGIMQVIEDTVKDF